MSKKVKGFQMLLKWTKLESVNRMYIRTKTGMTMSPEARKFKKEVSKQVRKQLPKPLPFNNKDLFKLSLHFILKTRFFVRDTSNFIKLIEDTIFDELDINDARNLELECKKSYLKDSNYEFVKATVEISDFDYEYFNKNSSSSEPEEKRHYTKEEVDFLLLEQAVEIMSNKLNLTPEEITKNKGVHKPLKTE
jgi:Holliday junction resolvase RusA-like endonuclease